MSKKIFFPSLVLALILNSFIANAQAAKASKLKNYQDSRWGFSFQYPTDYKLAKRSNKSEAYAAVAKGGTTVLEVAASPDTGADKISKGETTATMITLASVTAVVSGPIWSLGKPKPRQIKTAEIYQGGKRYLVMFNVDKRFDRDVKTMLNSFKLSKKPKLILTFPVNDLEKKTGYILPVRWTSENLPASSLIAIDLLRVERNKSKLVKTLADNVPLNKEVFVWDVEKLEAPPVYYKLRLRTVRKPLTEAASGLLSIYPKIEEPVTITISKPAGGETLRPGQEYDINWKCDLWPGSKRLFFRVDLRQVDANYKNAELAAIDDGTHTPPCWAGGRLATQIPTGAPAGQYQIVVNGEDRETTKTYEARSGIFSVVP